MCNHKALILLKTFIWEAIDAVDYILYVVDVLKYDFKK